MEHPRTTGPSSHGTGISTSSIMPSTNLSYSNTLSGTSGTSSASANSGLISGLNSMGISSSTSSHALTNYDASVAAGLSSVTGGTSSGVGNISIQNASNVSPLPSRAAAAASATHQMSSSMPPICQVRK